MRVTIRTHQEKVPNSEQMNYEGRAKKKKRPKNKNYYTTGAHFGIGSCGYIGKDFRREGKMFPVL